MILIVAFVVYYFFDHIRNLWILGNWEIKLQIILISAFFALLFVLLVYLVICSSLYHKWTKRNFVFDRFIRKDRPDETFPLLLLAHKEYQENQKYKVQAKNSEKKQTEEKTGFIFGKLDNGEWYTSPEEEEGNIACLGFPGTGKTTGIDIPVLLNWKGRVFCIDISGDISTTVKRPKQYMYCPDEGIGVYDVFFDVKRAKDKDERLEKLSIIAELLIPKNENISDNSKYFSDNGRKMLNAALIFYYKNGFEFGDMCLEICKQSAIELLRTISSDEEIIDDILPLISSFNGANEKNTQGCKETVDGVLYFFATNSKVRNSLRSINRQKKERGVAPFMLEFIDIFVCIPQPKLSVYGPLLRLMVGQMWNYFVGRDLDAKTHILFALDEFARFGRLPDIVDTLGTLRKRKVRVLLLTQQVSDLDSVYGTETRNAILGDCTYTICLGAKDLATQEYFTKLVGQHHEIRYGVNTGDNGSRFMATEEKTDIVESASLAYIHHENKLLLLTPEGYIFLKKNPWYNDEKLRARVKKLEELSQKKNIMKGKSTNGNKQG